MNVENVNKLINHLESIEDSEYDQKTYIHDCGTPACITAHAVYLSKEKNLRLMNRSLVGNEMFWLAQIWLDIPLHNEIEMCNPYPIERYKKTKKQEAINMLKNFLETGEVVWEKVI